MLNKSSKILKAMVLHAMFKMPKRGVHKFVEIEYLHTYIL